MTDKELTETEKSLKTARKMKDRIYLVTGATSGVGRAIAQGLAQAGAKVVLVSRGAESGQAARREIFEATGNDRVEFMVADLSLQVSVRKLATEFKKRFDHLDGLVHSAGALYLKKRVTAEGFDGSLAINFLSHFLLTQELLPLLKASAPARVLVVAARPNFVTKPRIDLDDLELKKRYGGLKAMSHALFGKMYFTFELARRLEGTGVTSVAFHPGTVRSKLIRGNSLVVKLLDKFFASRSGDTCEIGVYLASDDEVEEMSGVFYDDHKQVVPVNDAYDRGTAAKLWSLAEELTSRKAR